MNTAILSKTNHSAIISIMFNFRRNVMAFGIGNLLKAVAPLALTALTGGAAAPMLLNMAIKMAVQVAIQKVGQELGLPPQLTNLLSQAATGGQGANFYPTNFTQALQNVGMPQSDIGQIMRYADNVSRGAGDLVRSFAGLSTEQMESLPGALNQYAQERRAAGGKENERLADSVQDFAQQIASQNFLNNVKEGDRKLKGDIEAALKGTKSPMMKLAIVLGMIADKKSEDMMSKAKQIGQFGEVNTKKQGQFQQMNSELNALGQELGVLSQAMANVIKSMGEASSTLARKG
jgi:hypothetical protein